MKIHRLFSGIAAIVAISLLSSCAGGEKHTAPEAKYASVIKAYTGGTVTDGTPVRIEFAAPVPGIELGTDADAKLFSFSPSLKGSARWASAEILEFIP